MSAILVINAGSSSIKYQLIDPGSERRIATGLIERIGEKIGSVTHKSGDEKTSRDVPVPDHAAGFREMAKAFEISGTPLETLDLHAVGHRVVQGGMDFVRPTLIDDAVAKRINDLSVLAPLHNPGHYQAIVAAREAFSNVPHVAVFDTAFHQTIPAKAYTYAIDSKVARDHRVRRYGFHGTSHQFVSRRAPRLIGKTADRVDQIVLHMGNGASACAVHHGRSVDTSMGLTPLEGLVMGTRSGDLDPSIIAHLGRSAGMSIEEIDTMLNKKSGLLGMTGSGDMRDVLARAHQGDAVAQLGLDVFLHRVRHYIGAYMVQLGRVDLITFTAGIGENNAEIRELVCRGLEWFGLKIDQDRNHADSRGPRLISADDSRIAVAVVPTDEELEIARQTYALAG